MQESHDGYGAQGEVDRKTYGTACESCGAVDVISYWSEDKMSIFHRTKVITVSDAAKKQQVQELFAENHIKYKMKIKEIMQKNPIDTAVIGTLGMNRMKVTYSFYVEKEDAALAMELLRNI